MTVGAFDWSFGAVTRLAVLVVVAEAGPEASVAWDCAAWESGGRGKADSSGVAGGKARRPYWK